jgi:hypothetical protein
MLNEVSQSGKDISQRFQEAPKLQIPQHCLEIYSSSLHDICMLTVIQQEKCMADRKGKYTHVGASQFLPKLTGVCN